MLMVTPVAGAFKMWTSPRGDGISLTMRILTTILGTSSFEVMSGQFAQIVGKDNAASQMAAMWWTVALQLRDKTSVVPDALKDLNNSSLIRTTFFLTYTARSR